MTKNMEHIKKFNRFYMRIMALSSIYNDESPYSSTEAMIIHEIEHTKQCTASYLTEYFMLDKGYMSRIINKFETAKMIYKIPSNEDRRVYYLQMTQKGKQILEELSTKANANVVQMIEHVEEADLPRLIQSMQTIEQLLSGK